jgi:hypothetical protein
MVNKVETIIPPAKIRLTDGQTRLDDDSLRATDPLSLPKVGSHVQQLRIYRRYQETDMGGHYKAVAAIELSDVSRTSNGVSRWLRGNPFIVELLVGGKILWLAFGGSGLRRLWSYVAVQFGGAWIERLSRSRYVQVAQGEIEAWKNPTADLTCLQCLRKFERPLMYGAQT